MTEAKTLREFIREQQPVKMALVTEEFLYNFFKEAEHEKEKLSREAHWLIHTSCAICGVEIPYQRPDPYGCSYTCAEHVEYSTGHDILEVRKKLGITYPAHIKWQNFY